jgi:hypothetical protein
MMDISVDEKHFNGDQQNKNDEYSVNVKIEPNHEFEIQEIKYDGEEIYKE